MKLEQLDHFGIEVNQLAEAERFYTEVLGLTVRRRDGDNWTEFEAGPVRFAVHAVVEGHPVQPGGGTAVFEVADVDEARRILEERGVEFGHSADVAGYARYATFQDPDGNTIQVIEYTAR